MTDVRTPTAGTRLLLDALKARYEHKASRTTLRDDQLSIGQTPPNRRRNAHGPGWAREGKIHRVASDYVRSSPHRPLDRPVRSSDRINRGNGRARVVATPVCPQRVCQ